ncbi:MAG TPA: tripartite tricarboxylate transporter TctB family protein [Methylomirabilota bacterium]|jgi:hypothetical protein
MASRARVAALLAGVAGSGLLFAATWPLDAMVPRGQLGPGFWPRLALIGLAVACLLKLREERRAGPGGTQSPHVLPRVSASRLVLGMACILAYVIAAPLLGFALATAAFIVAFMVVAGARGVPEGQRLPRGRGLRSSGSARPAASTPWASAASAMPW